MTDLTEDFINLYSMPMSHIKGDIGEAITASVLREQCKMRVLRNLYIPDGNKFVEIDMIGISSHGLLVIENKNYTGRIRGSFNKPYWNVEYGFGHIEKLYNPVMQNELHIKRLSTLLGMSGFKAVRGYNIVLFNSGAELELNGCDGFVFSLDGFVEHYRGRNPDVSLTDKQMDSLYEILKPLSNPSDIMKMIHVSLLGKD